VLAIVAPGQGAQTPGFLRPWIDDPAFADRLTWLSAVVGIDLTHYGTEADAETIRDTAIAQPLLVASSMLAALSLFPHPADYFGKISVVAGHSVGEIAAATGAGVITAEQAMVFVRERGRAMAAASAVTPTGMTAVLGGERDDVLATLGRYNGGRQLVAAGTLEQLAELAADPPAGARLIPLSVAGAFHTEHMRPAVDVLARLARSISTRDTRTRLISNRDGQVIHSGPEVMKRLVAQVSMPVRWDLCIQTMSDLGVTGVLEMPPAGTLTGLARRQMKGVETFALKTPDQLEDALAFVEKHGDPTPIGDSPTWRMLVSPAKGTFNQAADIPQGSQLEPGSAIGNVANLRGETDVTAPYGGTIVEWIVEDGDLVSPGQPLVRLHPESE
jgi:[acyl-carrier-protein] S-malonyltransferase